MTISNSSLHSDGFPGQSAVELNRDEPSHRPPPEHGLATGAVLVVDDEPGMRNFLHKSLQRVCALVEAADSAETAEALRQRYRFDLLVVDIRLPGQSGVEWIEQLREQEVRCDIIVMTAYADLDIAIAALRAGASDFLLKPFRLEQMLASVERCFERRRIQRDNFLLRRQMPDTTNGAQGIVGVSPPIRDVCSVAQRVAPSPSTVLIEGETGTGKELVARAIHVKSGRSGPFVPINCGSISSELLESELFGHIKGAFTSAHANREGLFSFAHRGTLFLDEISELPLPMQAKLLRALEEKVIRPVGSDRETQVDVRVIAATNRELAGDVEAGRFREDLFFRLNVLAITVPPLRERVEDVALLAEHFSASLSRELGVEPIPFSCEDYRRLGEYPWPGNVRELRNVVERSMLLGELPGDLLEHGAFGAKTNSQEKAKLDNGAAPASMQAGGFPIDWSLEEVERVHILKVLESAAGNKSQAARTLGVSRKTLERKLKSWRSE